MRRATDRAIHQWVRRICVFVLIGIALASCMHPHAARAAEPQVRVPEHAVLYRLQVEREAARNFGIGGDAVVARLAAQIHQESGWREDAASPYAYGLAQFTPATARWLPSVCPGVGAPDPWDASWAIRAQSCYMAWLYRRTGGIGPGPMDAC